MLSILEIVIKKILLSLSLVNYLIGYFNLRPEQWRVELEVKGLNINIIRI